MAVSTIRLLLESIEVDGFIAYSHTYTEQETMSSEKRGNQAKGRRWMLVINNPTSKESWAIADLAHDDHVAGLMWSVEHAHEAKDNEAPNGTEHYHIYVNFKNPVRFAWLKERFHRADIELARKPALACCRYVAKDGFYQSFGNIPDITTGSRANSQAAKRKAEDLAREAVVNKIRKGELRFNDLTDEQLLDTKLVRAAKDAASMTQGPMRPEVYICCFVSPTGWGKSYSVWETFQHVASVEFGGTQEWFLDAEQEVMLFDEFCGQVRAQKMLKYLDCYPISLPIKGGHRPCYWKLIFICSNTAPDEWYMKDDPKTGMRVSSIPDEVRKALYRRIGYPQPTARGETHVYSETFTSLLDAQHEMKEICVRLHQRIYPEGVPSQLRNEDPDQVRAEHDEIRQLAEIHGINLDEEEARWERAREIQRERELNEYDDMPELEPGDDEQPKSQVIGADNPSSCPSEQNPMASVPQIEYEELSDEDDDDKDTCPDPPEDVSDNDDDFEH